MKSPKTILLLSILFLFSIHESYSRAHWPLLSSVHSNNSTLINSGSPTITQTFRANLYAVNSDSTISLEDGNMELYGASYCDCVNWLEDAKKMTNILENFAIERDGQLMSIEARQPIGLTDTVFYNMTHMELKNYYLSFIATNLDHPGLFGFLEDSYTGASTPINLNGSTTVPFSVTTDPASSNPNRFQVVFTTLSVLSGVTGIVPVTYTSVKAWQQNNNIAVQWQVDNQTNVSKYQVEKSLDGIQFNEASTIIASANSTATYNWVDSDPSSGNNFYRIKEINSDGGVEYSEILKVSEGETGQTISIYPNPVVSGILGLQMNNMPAGNYTVRLLNNFGQVVFSKLINHSAGSTTETLSIGSNISKGVYRLEVIHPDNDISNINVVF